MTAAATSGPVRVKVTFRGDNGAATAARVWRDIRGVQGITSVGNPEGNSIILDVPGVSNFVEAQVKVRRVVNPMGVGRYDIEPA